MQTMLSNALRDFTAGPLNQLLVNLAGQDSARWEEQFKHFLRQEPCWVKAQVQQIQPTSLLTLVSSIVIPATTESFHAKKKIVVDTGRKAKPKIYFVSDNVKEWFLQGDGLIEAPMGESTIYYHKLERSSADGLIIEALGGQDKVVSTFAQIHALMTNHHNGEEGVLLTNGWWNIFYVKGANGVLRPVPVAWRDAGWHVYARSLERPREWYVGYQVFSSNSVLVPLEPAAVA